MGIAGLLALVTATQGADGLPFLMLFATACIRILPNATRMIASLGGIRANEFASEEVAKVIRSMSPEEQRLQMVEFKDEIDPATIINSGIEPVDVQIDNLVYRYPDGDKDVLKDIQLDVPAGTSVAFVGGSGSGKTTLVDLILGLLTPTSGTISSQGKDIHTDLHSWYQKIGYVPQDPYLGNGTLREAVAFGIPAKHIDDDRVIYCLELAELMPVVETLEDGINTSDWCRMVTAFPVVSVSVWVLRVRCTATRACWLWMRQPVHWTMRLSTRLLRPLTASPRRLP